MFADGFPDAEWRSAQTHWDSLIQVQVYLRTVFKVQTRLLAQQHLSIVCYQENEEHQVLTASYSGATIAALANKNEAPLTIRAFLERLAGILRDIFGPISEETLT